MSLTNKQRELMRLSFREPKRWNISVGAVRSGKTYLDYFRIPRRIMEADRSGCIVLVGNTEGTVERNILMPMREMYGSTLVGNIRSGGRVRLFGRDCYVIGAARCDQAAKLQGASLSYCYGDEITTWSEDVFRMIMSRLDKPTSVFDGTCNPASPFHWFKSFLDREENHGNIRVTAFGIDDNPHIAKSVIEDMKREYSGTVYYDRLILGAWKAAEGAVYPEFAEGMERFVIDDIDPDEIIMADIGVDFGGSGSATAFNLTGYTAGYKKIITLDEYYRKETISPDRLEKDFIKFAKAAKKKYPRLYDVYCDSAEQVLIKGLKNAVRREGLALELRNARKGEINQRIRFYNAIMGSGRYFISSRCVNTIRAFGEAVWMGDGSDRRLDNGSVNIDSLDAQEYSTERRMDDIISMGGRGT